LEKIEIAEGGENSEKQLVEEDKDSSFSNEA